MKRYSVDMRIVVLLLGIAAASALMGCSQASDSDDGITVEAGSLSRAEFIKRAERLCEKTALTTQQGFLAYERETQASSPAEKKAGAAKFIDRVLVPAYEKQREEVTSLGAPSEDVERIAKIYEAVEDGLDEAKAEPLAFLRRASPFKKAARLGTAYGFFFCAGP